MSSEFDVIVIGCGPGGLSAAVTAKQLGASVCIIEKEELGGVCVNKGCIPTKTILNAVSLYNKLKKISQYGINASGVSIDYEKIFGRVTDVVSNIRKDIKNVLNFQKIEVIKGNAKLISQHIIKVADKELKTKNIIIAAGSKAKALKNYPFNNKSILSSEDFLQSKILPKSILIIGAGIIGCEWAGILSSLGVSVTLVEAMNKILPQEDSDLTRIVDAALKKMGVEIKLGSIVEKIDKEKTMVCIGRSPLSEGFEIVNKREGGWIKVDEYMRTNLENIYAIGDVAGNALLAYTAEREGKAAANNALGNETKMDYTFVPRVVFSIPELASVGIRENEINDTGVVRAYFKGLGRALSDDETEGFVKIIYDKHTKKILGAGIVGKNASELINEPALAIKCGLTTKQWLEVIHPHPVFSEIFGIALEKTKDVE